MRVCRLTNSVLTQVWNIAHGHSAVSIRPVGRSVEQILQNRMSAMYRAGVLQGDSTMISAHVWEVPIWYRTIFPYGFRRRLRLLLPQRLQCFGWRPRLVRVGQVGIRCRLPSEVVCRKGRGLVGIALRDNDPGAIYWIDLRDSEFVDALSRGKIAWSQLNPALTHHLSFKNARLFADRYSQIL